MVFKPPNMIPGRRYPTLLAVYGGPKAQLVTNSFKVWMFLTARCLPISELRNECLASENLA